MTKLTHGTEFKRVRNQLRFTQSQMAEALVIDRSYLSQIENGRKIPSNSLIRRLEMLDSQQPSNDFSTIEEPSSRYGDAAQAAGSMVTFSPGHDPTSPTPNPNRADCERHFRRWLDHAQSEPGMIGYTWVMLQKHFTPEPPESKKER